MIIIVHQLYDASLRTTWTFFISVQETQRPGRHPTELHENYRSPIHAPHDVQGGQLVFKLAPNAVVYNPRNNIIMTADQQRCGTTYLIAGNYSSIFWTLL